MTIHGRGLEDCAVVTVRRATTRREVPAHLVNGTLVFTIPDDLLAAPGGVSVQVRGGSDIPIEVVKAEGQAQTAEPFISKITPDEAVVPVAGKARVLLEGENIDPQALVLFRLEGEGSEGLRLEATPVSGKAQLEAAIPSEVVRESGAYELCVVNPTARRSNWVRVELKVSSAADGARRSLTKPSRGTAGTTARR